MSTITEITFFVPGVGRRHAVRFADLFERYPVGTFGGGSYTFRPEPIEDNGTRASSARVFHFAVNHLDFAFIEAVKAEPWPVGTVLTHQCDEYDNDPIVTVWTPEGPVTP